MSVPIKLEVERLYGLVCAGRKGVISDKSFPLSLALYE